MTMLESTTRRKRRNNDHYVDDNPAGRRAAAFPMTMIDHALRDAVHHASHHGGIGYICSNRTAPNAA
jgi:hypothetical protein